MSIYARRGNKVLRISEDAVDRYLGMGYSILNDKGQEVKKAIPHGVTELTNAYAQQSAEIAALQAEVAKLKAENAKLKKESQKPSERIASKYESAEATSEAEAEKPKRSRKRASADDQTES